MMDSITIKNFRCFREVRKARLAPLTLLVGENSTGKTSFLAMIRALWDVAFGHRVPDFKEDPYDLGSFHEIAHRDGHSSSVTDHFVAGFEHYVVGDEGVLDQPFYFETTFKKSGTRPIPTRRYYAHGDTSIEEHFRKDHIDKIVIRTEGGSWKREMGRHRLMVRGGGRLDLEDRLLPVFFYLLPHLPDHSNGEIGIEPLAGSPPVTEKDLQMVNRLVDSYEWTDSIRPFASAPVRSKPHRTYDPSRPTWDSQGNYIPMYLANLFSQDKSGWEQLRDKLEAFGHDAGLFTDLVVKQLGDREGGPFQIQIKKAGHKSMVPLDNLSDVGYGVSQVLPLITELLREDAPSVFLLQQPEVHLHPSAQAALGTLFCQVAGRDRQLVIETHSDHILDRIRMDVRDGESALTPDDISVLFFEGIDRDVHVHPLRFDENGNVLGTPGSYRRFFMEESRRSFGL